MPFQALAWAWKRDLSIDEEDETRLPSRIRPIVRLALLWLSREADEDGALYFDHTKFAGFAGCSARDADLAVECLETVGLVIVDPTSTWRMVCFPVQSEFNGDNFVPVPNRVPIPLAVHAQVLAEHRRRCFGCSSDHKPHVDHIFPRAKGGTNWPENLQVLCERCNLTKSDRTGWVAG